MKLAMYQMANAGSVKENLNKSLNAIAEAAKNHADMILFPEVQLTEFFPQFYLPSDDGFHVWDTPFGKIGIIRKVSVQKR